jgi:glucose/arabinose dehydrogenase
LIQVVGKNMKCKEQDKSIAVFAGMAALLCLSASTAIASDEIDGLTLPSGFHASLVVDALAGARHLAFRQNGDLFVSTRGENASGIVAIHLSKDHKADRVERFTMLGGGTGIRVYGDNLYATSPTSIYRFALHGGEFLPADEPETIVQGMPDKGFSARPISFDDRGTLFVGVGGSANICTDVNASKGTKPVGLAPCPDLDGRAGIWSFDSRRANQRFPSDGKQIATGLRDVGAIDWRTSGGLYAVMHNRNGTHATWPELVSASDELAIAEEMHRIAPGSNLGWPYTYVDGVHNLRLVAPEYGGDGKLLAPAGKYSVPVVNFPGHRAPLDMVFYKGSQFPRSYRGGAFVIFHGGLGPDLAEGHSGYDVQFVPFTASGHAGNPFLFIGGFAGPELVDRNASRAKYRPVGAAVGPDGSLYIADSQKGRIWRIFYTGSDK